MKKYNFEPIEQDDKYAYYHIIGVQAVYMKTYEGKLLRFTGGGGLLKNPEYRGYCNLCAVRNSQESFNGKKKRLVAAFEPLYDKEGNAILIRYDHDEVFALVDNGGYKDDKGNIVEATISIPIYGSVTEFNQEK